MNQNNLLKQIDNLLTIRLEKINSRLDSVDSQLSEVKEEVKHVNNSLSFEIQDSTLQLKEFVELDCVSKQEFKQIEERITHVEQKSL